MPANRQILRQPTSGKEMVITSSTAPFLRGGGAGGGTSDLFGGGGIEPPLLSEMFALLVSDPLFLLFSLFLASKRIITSFKNMSFNDLSSIICFSDFVQF